MLGPTGSGPRGWSGAPSRISHWDRRNLVVDFYSMRKVNGTCHENFAPRIREEQVVGR